MAVTAKDIANQLGLSQPTVSRILNGTRGHRIAEATRVRVVEAARRMDYRPNAVARSLRRQRTNIVGFYSGYASLNVRHDFLGAIIGGLQRACEPHGLDLLLHGVQAHRSMEEVYRDLTDGRIDGLFFHATIANPLVARLAASSLKVIALVNAMPNVPAVVADGADGMRQLVNYLWSKGHRRIAYVSPMQFESVHARRQAFLDEMQKRGASPIESPVISTSIEDTLESAAAVWNSLKELEVMPTAVCCWNDRAAYKLLWHCMQIGVRVPDELAIAGFDGFLETKIPVRELTTVTVPYGDMTERALELMMNLFDGTSIPMTTVVPVTLTPGDTA